MAGTSVNLRLLVFDDDLLSRSKAGAVWGRVYFDLNGAFFPDSGWSDLVLVVVGGWLEAMIQAAAGNSATAKVFFMDGPFTVSIDPGGSGLAALNFSHRGIVRHSMVARPDDLLQDAISAADKLVNICARHGWSDNSDCSRLAAMVKEGLKRRPV